MSRAVSGRLLLAATGGLALLGLLVLAPLPARAQQPPQQPEKIAINFNGVDLEILLQRVSEVSNVRFLYDEKIKKRKVYLLSQSEIPTKDLFSVFQTVMKSNGFALIKSGPPSAEIYQVVESAVAPKSPTEVIRPGDPFPEGEPMVTMILTLKYAEPRTVQAALQPLVTDPKGVLTMEDVSAVIVTDFAQNVKRLSEIVALMDREKPGIKIEVVQLFYAGAQDIEQKLTKHLQVLLQVQRRPGQQQQEVVQVTADTRTNKLVVLAQEERLAQIRAIVKELDIPIKSEPQLIHVYNVKHAAAKILAENLSKVYQAIAQGRPNGSAGSTQPTVMVQPAVNPPGQAGGPGAGVGLTVGGAGGATLVSTGGQTINPAIVADEPNNALIVVADDKTYETQILPTIKALDIRRPQVLLEAALVEITGEGSLDIGIEAGSVNRTTDNLQGFGSTSFGLSSLIDTDGDSVPDAKVPFATSASGLVPTDGLTAGAIKSFGGRIPVLLQALKSKRDTNVLSQPSTVVNDNTNATLKVTDSAPTTSFTQSNSTTITSFSGFQEAGVTLSITPHISESAYLRLEIEQKLERFVGTASASGVPPPKTTRQINDTVTIPSGRTLVIGGLTRDDETETVTGVPGLMDIPWIGELFRRTVRNRTKTTLYIFVTPTILDDEDFGDLAAISRRKQLEVFERTKGRWVGVREEDEALPRALDIVEYKSPFGEAER
ncbi:MAG: type II secretion system secretin GspD [Planctomycetes bacterium]|nr:type II secretion system secretin GspD [Planctomycetota bacterium]